ncbi:MAG: acetylxylan esterase [Planctomycetes bacterium]|nr:acetylxylan esterase [Planctomycetota bacterium]
MSTRFLDPRICIVPVLMSCNAVAAADVTAKAVSFNTTDGVRIAADYYAPRKSVEPAPIAILLHMYNSDRSAWKPLIEPLHEAGFAILAIDMRGHGAGATDELKELARKRDRKMFKAMEKDVFAAYEWVSKQGDVDRSRLAIVGASVGCSVALRYTVSDPSVDAVVCMSPGLKYLAINSSVDIKRFHGRKLLFLASEEERNAADQLKKLGDTAGKKAKSPVVANEIETRIVGEGRVHGTAMFGKIDGIEQRIVDFLKENVGGWSEDTVYGAWKDKKFHKADSAWSRSADQTKVRHLSDPDEAKRRGLKSADDKPKLRTQGS